MHASRCRYDLMSRLMRQAPAGVQFKLLIGGDLAPTLRTWRSAALLLQEVHFIITARPGCEDAEKCAPPPEACHVEYLARRDAKPMETWSDSSTAVRALFAKPTVDVDEDRAVLDMIPPCIMAYARMHRLYAC
ncbi:hypothetical protein EON66_02510 [archaeon]|nr:MAG: hypothetical protein EON66_02510 [archaeon]